jgi:glycosyltransferase involved in cell wall biosynthesis
MDKPISVMHLIYTMAYGGVETALINWVQKMDQTKFTTQVVCFANPGNMEAPFVEAAERQGVSISKIPWARRKPLLKAARALARLVREQHIDILHAHNPYANFVCALAAKLTPVKTITTLYVWVDLDWKQNTLQFFDKYAIRAFDQITAHCEQTRLATIERGIPADRVKTLTCGFETHRMEMSNQERLERRRAAGIADDQILLVNVARFYPEKAQDSLLRCFKDILLRCRQARLWIAGVGPLEDRLRKLCTQLALDHAVTFLGFVPDLPALLALADIQVHPAIIEGVPLAICAGMAAGLPIVASAVGGVPEVIHHDCTGVLVPPGDEQGFVEAVSRLIRSPEEGRQLGRSARHFIENDYSLATAVKRVEQTYYGMLGIGDSTPNAMPVVFSA